MRLRLRSRDLNDLLPILGPSVQALPVALDRGAASFDGKVTGPLDAPVLTGQVTASRVVYAGRAIRSVEAQVEASPSGVTARRGTLRGAGSLLVEFDGSVGLNDWDAEDSSPLDVRVAVRDAPLAELADDPAFPVTGTVSGSARFSGTCGRPRAAGDLRIVRGVFHGEPFDTVTATFAYADRQLKVPAARIAAGARAIDLQGAFEHPAEALDRGRLRFQASSNEMPLSEFRTIAGARPGVHGTLRFSAAGAMDVAPGRDGRAWRIAELRADAQGRGMQMADGRLGDARLTAASAGRDLVVHLESDFANSVVRGDGRWSLDGDNLGSATVKFPEVDLKRLRDWLSPPKTPDEFQLAGSAEAELTFNGPALNPRAWRAMLRIPRL
jgi:autotransporter translocation and assembly factor TamB